MRNILLCTLLFSYHLITAAQSGSLNEKIIRREIFESTIADLGPGCRIKISIPKLTNLAQGYQSNQHRGVAGFSIKMPPYPHFSNGGEWGFTFNCYQTKEEQFQRIWDEISPKDGVKFTIRSRRKTFIAEDGGNFISLQAVNAVGWAVTYDDTAGDERFRSRHLSYCIRNESNAICGNSDIGYIEYLENKKNIDIQSAAIRILESIEFLEDAAPSR